MTTIQNICVGTCAIVGILTFVFLMIGIGGWAIERFCTYMKIVYYIKTYYWHKKEFHQWLKEKNHVESGKS